MSQEPVQISQKQARAWLMANQGLADPFPSPEDAVRTLFAVQTQYAASLGVAVAARVKRMKPSWPDDAINRDPTLIKTWSLRSTLHVHHVSDRVLLKTFNGPKYQQFLGWMKTYQDKNVRTHDNEDRMLAVLESGPKTRVELHEAVPQLKELGWTGWGADVKGLAFKGDVILAPSGPGASKFVLAEQWLGPISDDGRSYQESVTELLRRYLRAHAPASLTDFRFWAGIYATAAKQALADLRNEVVPVQIKSLKEVRYILANQEDALQEITRASGVRLLAKFDPLLLAHKDRELYLDRKDYKKVFQIAGQVEAAVLIDGIVAGIWRLSTKGKSGAIAIQPFRDFTEREVVRIDKEADRLRKALGLKEIAVDHSALHVIG
jgi:uncharacterized protein YcaQ